MKRAKLETSPEFIVEILKGTKAGFNGHFSITKNGLPGDAECVGVAQDTFSPNLYLVVESESFKDVDEKDIPLLDIPEIKTTRYSGIKGWAEFRKTGLLLFINSILHIFGWAIINECEHGETVKVYPSRVKYSGFDEKSTTEAYVKISEYMKENAETLLKETEE